MTSINAQNQTPQNWYLDTFVNTDNSFFSEGIFCWSNNQFFISGMLNHERNSLDYVADSFLSIVSVNKIRSCARRNFKRRKSTLRVLASKLICWFLSMQLCMQYSLFGSILTVGAMIGAITSGPIADYIGRKGVRKQMILWIPNLSR